MRTTETTAPMNIFKRMKLAMMPEPEKTFIKAGIMNEDTSLTDAGRELFLAFLLSKNKNDFKTEVVDQLIAEEEKENKRR